MPHPRPATPTFAYRADISHFTPGMASGPLDAGASAKAEAVAVRAPETLSRKGRPREPTGSDRPVRPVFSAVGLNRLPADSALRAYSDGPHREADFCAPS